MKPRNILETIPNDKRLHYIVGSIAFPLFVFVAHFLFPTQMFVAACVGDLVLGLAIEIYQRLTGKGTYDIKDAIWVLIGGIAPGLCYLMGVYFV